jgi:putative PIN family toxin of toxin-antitoxin system
MPRRVVLDTNILVAGWRGASFQVLSLLGSSHFEPCVSVPLMFEYEDVVSRASLALPKAAVNDVLDYFCSVSHLQEIHYLWRPYLNDPKDDLVLEVAVASQSSAIITFNLKDFVSVSKFGLKALTPGDFLGEIGVKK